MIDPFVLLTPILVLGVIALLKFIGCDVLFGIQAIPPTPPLLKAVGGIAQVTLSWSGYDGNPVSYIVKRGAQHLGPYAIIKTVAAQTATYTDTDSSLMNGTPVYYLVSAVDSDGGNFDSNEAPATPAAVPGRPPGAVVDPSNALSNNLVGLFVMNEGSGTTDLNLVDGQKANFFGAAPATWNIQDPSIVFNGGGSLNSYLDAGTDTNFDQLPISQISVVAKVNVNTVAAAGVCEKNDDNTAPADSGFLFGWDGTGSLQLSVEMAGGNMRAVTVGGIVQSGQWMQVAFTWDGTGGDSSPETAAHLFLNGAEPTRAPGQNGNGHLGYTNATDKPFRIGNASFDAMAGSLNGKMAYLAVYKGRILTPAELNQLDVQLPIK
jgi:hypothetical protein